MEKRARLPPYHADERRAWVARMPGADLELRVEAAAWRGQPFYFEVVFSRMRFGLLTLCTHFLVFLVCLQGSITADRQVRFFGSGAALAGLVAALGLYGAWVALGRRPLLAGLYDD